MRIGGSKSVLLAVVVALCLSGIQERANGQGYWRFEEASGTTVLDAGPHGLDGTLNPQPTRAAVVGVGSIPQNDLANGQALDLGYVNTATGGRFRVDDPLGNLAMNDSSMTIEAWVRLDQLGDTSGSSERQWLCQKKPDFGPDSKLDYGVLVQAGPLGVTGRELAFRYGDGESSINVVSSLEITDLEWHFVSIAHNAETQTLRFGLDGVFETHSVSKPGELELYGFAAGENTPPLFVGLHKSESGTANQYLRGSIDEVRITRGFLPTTDLLDNVWQDCNTNGVADYDDFASGYSLDCNGNFIPDECDIAGGLSDDCNLDWIPDECQLGLEPAQYSHHRGTYDGMAGSDGAYTGWLEWFVVEDGASLITHIDVLFSDMGSGKHLTMYIWSDPNGDGDPTDAQVLSSLPMTVEPPMAGQWNRIDMPDVDVGPDGTSFFIGAAMTEAWSAATGAAHRTPFVYGVSWIIGTTAPIDPNDLSANAIEFEPIEDNFQANWLLRAVSETGADYGDCNGNGVPDSCDIDSGFSDDSNTNGVSDECEFVDTYYVPDDFVSIHAGVNGPPAGSTVIVRPGVYHENIEFSGKAIELRSELGPELTTINGGSTAEPVVSFLRGEGPDTVIDGFRLINGTGNGRWGGGGIFARNSAPTILNNIVEQNFAYGYGGGIFVYRNTDPVTIRGNTVRNNHTDKSGGGIMAWSQDNVAFIEDNIVENNVSETHGGGVHLAHTSTYLFGNEIAGNSAPGDGGGVYVYDASGAVSVIIAGNDIQENSSDWAGGVYIASAGTVEVTNNLIRGNTADWGGAMLALAGVIDITNNTISDNEATGYTGGILVGSVETTITNSIIRGNTSPFGDPNLYVDLFGGAVLVSHSNITGGWTGTGNIDTEPLYVDAAGDDYRLAAASPGIDAGDSTVPQLSSFPDYLEDLAGDARFVNDPDTADTGVPNGSGDVVDIGAYEYQLPVCVADLTTTGAGIGDPGYGVPDGQVTGIDLQYYVNFWLVSDLTVADLTTTGAGIGDPGYGVPDGQVTGIDIQYYVNLWLVGCPQGRQRAGTPDATRSDLLASWLKLTQTAESETSTDTNHAEKRRPATFSEVPRPAFSPEWRRNTSPAQHHLTGSSAK